MLYHQDTIRLNEFSIGIVVVKQLEVDRGRCVRSIVLDISIFKIQVQIPVEEDERRTIVVDS